MAINYQQTDTAGEFAIAAFCSADTVTASSNKAAWQASSGGSAGTASHTNYGANSSDVSRVNLNFDITIDSGTSWDAGTWTVRLNLTSAQSQNGCTWTKVYICRVNSAGVNQETLGSNTAVGISLGTTGVKSANVTGNAATSPASTDRVVVVMSITNGSSMFGTTGTIKTDQLISSPFTSGAATLSINKSDSITVTESVSMFTDKLYRSVSDSITVTELIDPELVSFVSKSDTVNLTENTSLLESIEVSESENITITENIDLQSATVSGTFVPTATETDVVNGGKTTVITLLGDTWVAAGALSFDLQRQNIINGITSAQSEATGWNLVPQATQNVNGVVRTSDTVVTITWDAFPTYNITAQETITTTVPGTALNSGLAIVATPVFTISTVVPTLTISESEDITITESANLSIGLAVNVSESITVTESIKTELNSFINKSDSVTVTENTSLLIPELYVLKSDSVTLTENLKAEQTSFINKSESITTTENVVTELTSFVNVSDSATVTENIDPELFSRVSVSDSITVSESAVVSIDAGVVDLSVNTSDSIALTESLKDELNSFVDKSDNVTITEAITSLIPSLFINRSDSVTVTESIGRLLVSFVTKSESATVSESTDVFIPILNLSPNDSTTLTESITVNIVQPGVPQISVSDGVTISESASLLIPTLFVQENETATVSENIIVNLPTLHINRSDSITVSESISVSISSATGTGYTNILLMGVG